MAATFVIEISLLIYALVRYKLTPITRLIGAVLFFLALFQLAEYNVCGGLGADAGTWSRIGYVSITMLPALGIHLVQLISGHKWRSGKWIAYINMGIWVSLFAFAEHAFQGHVCAGNYIIFQLNPTLDRFYSLYYFGWLFIGIGMSLYLARSAKKSTRESLVLLVAGYLVFMVPATIIKSLNPTVTAGLPSIMCGFAVIFAFILAFGVLPRMSALKIQKDVQPVDKK